MASPKANDRTHGHVQRETGTDSFHVERVLVIRMHPEEWRIRYNIPAHIYNRLSDGERERARLYVEDLFRKMWLVAKVGNVANAEQICLEECVRTYVDGLYRLFVRLQFEAGNQKWLVPASIQTRVLEEN